MKNITKLSLKSSLMLWLFISFFNIPLYTQDVEILGKLKVSSMDTLNEEELFVIKQTDGTLAGRQIASLPFAPENPINTDTIRTLQSDLMLIQTLCNCPNLPSAMIQSLQNVCRQIKVHFYLTTYKYDRGKDRCFKSH